MRTPALALAWEIWRKHRAANLCVVALLPLSALLFATLALWIPDLRAFPGRPAPAWPLLIFPMLGSLVWVLNVFTNTEGDAKRGFTGMPPRLFALPLRTEYLVGCLAGLGVCFLVLTYLAWAGAIQWVTGFALPLRWPLLALAAVMVCFQAVVWGLASFPWIRILVIVGGAVGALVLTAVMIEANVSERTRQLTWTAILGGLVPTAVVGAWLGVSAERSGGWQAWDRLIPLLRAVRDALPRRTRDFVSADTAQFWFEWRRRGLFLSIGLTLSIAGAAILFPVVAMLDSNAALPWRSVFSTLFYPLLLSGLAGLGIARSEFWSKEVQMQPFQALRPISDSSLFAAKLCVAGVVTVLGWLMAVPLVYLVLSWSRWHELWRLDEAGARLRQLLPGSSLLAGLTMGFVIFAVVALSWRTMTAALSLGLTGNRRRIAIEPFIGAACFLFLVFMGGWLSQRPTGVEDSPPALEFLSVVIVAAKIFGAGRAWIRVRSRSLLSSRMLVTLGSLWVGNAGIFVALAVVLWAGTSLPKPLILLALAWAWPAGELFRGVLHLEANRHR